MSGCKSKLYESVSWRKVEKGYELYLNDNLLKTPQGRIVRVPSLALAKKLAAEYQSLLRGDNHSTVAMPYSSLAMTSWDYCDDGEDDGGIVTSLASFLEHDYLCYRAEDVYLRERQEILWDKWLLWFKEEHGIALSSTHRLAPLSQAGNILKEGRNCLMNYDRFHLAVFSQLSSLSHSFVLALASVSGAMKEAEFCAAAFLDDEYQLEFWGEDEILRQRLREMQLEAHHGFSFLTSLLP